MAKNNKPIPPQPKSKPKTKAKAKPVVPAKTKPKVQVEPEVATINEALKGLGYIFNIVASGTFTPAQLTNALAKCGLSQECKVTERSYLNAIQMAAKRTNGETPNGEPFKVEQLQKDADGIVVAYYERERTFDNNNKVKLGKYTMRSKAYFEFASESWLTQPAELSKVGFFKRVKRYKTHLFGGDLRYWIFNPLFAKMKCMPSIGGAKFVVNDEPLFAKMIDFCKEAGIQYRSYTQMADDETKAALAQDVRGNLTQTLENIKDKIADIQGKDKPRRDSVENAKKQLEACKGELTMMAKLLGFKMQDIEQTISDLQAEIDGVKITAKSGSKKDEYKVLLSKLMGEEYEISTGVYVIPGDVAQEAGIKLPKRSGAALAQSVFNAIAELGYMGGYHGQNLVLKEVKVTEVEF